MAADQLSVAAAGAANLPFAAGGQLEHRRPRGRDVRRHPCRPRFRREKREQGLRTGPPHHHPHASGPSGWSWHCRRCGACRPRGTSLLIVWYGGRLHLRGQADVGDIFAFQIYALLLLQPVFQIVSSVSQTQKSLAAMERVFEVLEMPPDKPDAPDAVDAPRQVREIRFEHVDFEYRPGVRVIRDFDLVVPGGATVALVGPSGAGKTTLTDLVAQRFHDPTAGAIGELNGIDLRRLRLARLPQPARGGPAGNVPLRRHGGENISYGRRGPPTRR